MELLWLAIALVVGFGVGWVLSGWRSTAEMARFEGRIEELQGRLVRAQRANDALLAEAGNARDRSKEPPASADGDGRERPDQQVHRAFADGLYDEADAAPDDGDDGGAYDHVEADDLTLIRGIGEVLQEKLHDLGITSYQQVAALTAEESADLDRALRLRGRIERDDWVGQAKRLSAE